MGVGGSFSDLLKPCARHDGAEYLRGRRVAVDLSVWVISAVRVPARRPHLRTTFFRTLYLFAAMGASPVFVLDGPPSPLKSRFFRRPAFCASSSSSPTPANGRNVAFTRYISECVELLRHLGMPVLCASGEAEALCAQLNRDGHVHACITSDSDAFLFGAQTVIKALRLNSKEPFECYHMADIESAVGLKRKQMVAIALLVGCDHDRPGVRGVGLATALRFVKSFHEDHVLDKLHEIGKGIYPPRLFLNELQTRNGKNWQTNVCKRLAAEPNFPNEEIIKLYLCSDHHNLDAENGVPALRWDEPDVDAVVDFLGYTQNWAPSTSGE